MFLFARFARKYFEECRRNLERALRALNFGDYPARSRVIL